MLITTLILLSAPFLALAKPVPETTFAELAKRSTCWQGDGNCNQCIVNAVEEWNRHESGQQFRRCYFSMVESLNGQLQWSPPDQQYSEKHKIQFSEPLVGANFMVNKITSFSNEVGRTGGPWCHTEDGLDGGPFCETAFYLGPAADELSRSSCSKALLEWQHSTNCMTG